ncbi:hypothetical protein BGZ76_005371, partial [Entomortierella beljakovae]
NTTQRSSQTSEKRVRFGNDDFDSMAPGNPFEDPPLDNSSESFIPGTLEDSTGEYSVTLDRPEQIVRLVGLGQESSSLVLGHWIFDRQDISQKLMKYHTMLVKSHETLQIVHEILQLNFIFTMEAMADIIGISELAPITCCLPILSPPIALAISELAFTAAVTKSGS